MKHRTLCFFTVLVLMFSLFGIGAIAEQNVNTAFCSFLCPDGFSVAENGEVTLQGNTFSLIIRKEQIGRKCDAEEFLQNYNASFASGLAGSLGVAAAADGKLVTIGNHTFIENVFVMDGLQYILYLLPIEENVYIFSTNAAEGDPMLLSILSSFRPVE